MANGSNSALTSVSSVAKYMVRCRCLTPQSVPSTRQIPGCLPKILRGASPVATAGEILPTEGEVGSVSSPARRMASPVFLEKKMSPAPAKTRTVRVRTQGWKGSAWSRCPVRSFGCGSKQSGSQSVWVQPDASEVWSSMLRLMRAAIWRHTRGSIFALRHLTRLTAALAWAVLLCASPAMAQKYYEPASLEGTHHIKDVISASDCIGPTYSVVNWEGGGPPINLASLNGIGLPLLQLVKKQDGQWITATATALRATSSGLGDPGSVFVRTLDAGGTLTVRETGRFAAPGESGTVTSLETLNLNSGEYKWHRVINISFGLGTDCPGTGVETQDRTAFFPTGLVEVAHPEFFSVTFVNPLVPSGIASVVDRKAVRSWREANALSADGLSAAVIVVRSISAANVTLSLAAQEGPQPVLSPFGSLAPFASDFLSNPSPPNGKSQTSLPPIPASSCDLDPMGRQECFFLALLWAPIAMPPDPARAGVQLTVTAKQNANPDSAATLVLMPPPLLLVHGLWSSASTWDNFVHWAGLNYSQPQFVDAVDYSRHSHLEFSDPGTQLQFKSSIQNLLMVSNYSGLISRQVDVVAHSMGGLVARYYLSVLPPPSGAFLSANPVHKLITIGTPHNGTPMAAELIYVKNVPITTNPVLGICKRYSVTPCTLSKLLSKFNKPLASGVFALQKGLPAGSIPESHGFDAVAGESPFSLNPSLPSSILEAFFNSLIRDTDPAKSVRSIEGLDNDALVPLGSQLASQNPLVEEKKVINGVVHLSWWGLDPAELDDPAVFKQVAFWLLGGTGAAPPNGMQTMQAAATSSSAPLPLLGLTGYTEVPDTNVSFSPAPNSILTVNAITNIAASSSTKTIAEILLFQVAGHSSDTSLLTSTQSPFAIPFTPDRIGTASFVAFAVFSDKTFAATTLDYTLEPNGNPLTLTLVNVPQTGLDINASTDVRVKAGFSNGLVDVTQLATYAVRSGTAAVFSVVPGGTITATGSGTDWLDVSYNGLTASARIAVGACDYSLGPTNQFVDSTGGNVTLQVAAAAGCGWTANGGDAWLTFTNAGGTGDGAITLTALPNASGSTRKAIVSVADRDVVIIQPATACTYAIAPAKIRAPASGVSGTLAVTSSCPIIVSSSADWVVPISLTSVVDYLVTRNTSSSNRTATITVGTQAVAVTQAGIPASVAPAVTLQPTNDTVTVNSLATFSADASGTPNPTVQWQVSANGGAAFTNVSGATTTTLSFTAHAPQNNNQYRAVFANSAGSAISKAATLGVNLLASCVNNLSGRGTPSGTAPARIDVTWTGIANVAAYSVFRGTTRGGPYTLIGNTTGAAYSDRSGLLNGNTYFYVLQPRDSSGSEVCQSNQAVITVPSGRR
jgi:pimeloyl-ACP methyl ester carboxylesterase